MGKLAKPSPLPLLIGTTRFATRTAKRQPRQAAPATIRGRNPFDQPIMLRIAQVVDDAIRVSELPSASRASR